MMDVLRKTVQNEGVRGLYKVRAVAFLLMGWQTAGGQDTRNNSSTLRPFKLHECGHSAKFSQ